MKLILLLLSLLFFSCEKDTYTPIDVSTVHSLAMSSKWAVIMEPYASFYTDNSHDATIESYGRIGDVMEVTGSSIDKQNITWYKFEQGWLSENTVRIYANKLQADFASKEYK